MLSKKTQGAQAERAALTYLKSNGLKLIKQNYYCRFGEIDLIMKDKETFVFVEVRQRQSTHYGSAEASITSQKQKRINLSVRCYLHQHQLTNKCASRIDVITFNGDFNDKNNINWIKNAF